MMNTKPILTAGLLLGLAGCKLAPHYQRPVSPVPEAWPESAKSEAAQAAEVQWEDYFTDPGLRAVVQLALANNRDMKVAALNVAKVQALYRIQRGELMPTMGVMASGSKSRTPERVNLATQGKNEATISETDSVQFGVLSWELDFFGRLRSLKDKALYQFLSTEQARDATRLSMVATVAQAYLAYAADQDALRLATSTFESQKAYHDLIAASREAGIASELDLSQAASQMESARADAARYKGLLDVDRNTLDLLAGGTVPANLLPKGLDGIQPFREVAAGLSSAVLLRRPDIRMSEFDLQAANANIGAARAAFFPSVSLTAGVGTLSPDVSHLFASGTRTWSFAPQITLPIFSGGSLWANLKVSKVDREIAVAQYEKSIQTAFKEVADGLAQRAALHDQLAAQENLVKALDVSYKLSDSRFQAGLDGYLGVLVAQRSLYGAQQGLVAVRMAQQANQVALFKALGGRMGPAQEGAAPRS